MALRLSNKRISPLDLNPNLTIGVSFPLNSANLHQGTKNTKTQIKTNLINILLTEPGERLHLPNYGVGLKNLLFEQQIDLPILKEQIIKTTARYIPNIKIMDVQTGMANEGDTVYIKITYKSTLNGNMDNVQLNFN